ncbi:MAG: lytic murein transglycosylase [Desulfovibrio sp.]|jgi:membrane-bound lytic murein transglycosylase B|nr:lytic murein transglycosylase [Desulfovibrio sp.]
MPNYPQHAEKKQPLSPRRASVEPLFILCVALLVSGFYIFTEFPADGPARTPGKSIVSGEAPAQVQSESAVSEDTLAPIPGESTALYENAPDSGAAQARTETQSSASDRGGEAEPPTGADPAPVLGESAVSGEAPAPVQSESAVSGEAPAPVQDESAALYENAPDSGAAHAQAETQSFAAGRGEEADPPTGADPAPVQSESAVSEDTLAPVRDESAVNREAPVQGESAVADENLPADGEEKSPAVASGEGEEKRQGADGEAAKEAEEPDPAFSPLIARLHADGFPLEETRALFARLGPNAYTPAYMGLKMLELSGVSGIGVSRETGPDPELPEGAPLPLSDLNVGACLEFAAKYEDSLVEIEKNHGVHRSVILGILLVETALGKNLGSDVAMRALAGMAVTDSVDRLGSAGNSRQASRLRFGRRLSATLRQRSERAYGELAALLRWSEKAGLDAARLPGSIYGAVGLCQFMPSNIEPYGVDGDRDGKINLFSPVDAMFSAANYLEAHGWRRASTDARRRAVLMAYNDDSMYAAYVLGTAKRMERALAGKLSPQSPAMGGMPASARLDPSLRRLKSVPRSGRVTELGSYEALLK